MQTLSRVEVITAPVSHDALAAAQVDDEELRTLLVSTTLQLTKSSSLRLQSSCTATPLLVNHAHTSRLLSAVIFSTSCTPLATPVLRQQLSSSLSTSCVQSFRKTAALGHELANPASAPTFPDTQSLKLATSPSRLPASFTFTSTFSALYHPRQDFNTASRQ